MKKLLYILVLLSAATVSAQYSLKKAEALYAEYDYPKAAKAYEAYLEGKHKPSEITMLHIADTYFYLNDFAKAEKWYAQLYKKQHLAMEQRQFGNYVQSLRAQKKYDSADSLLAEWYTLRKEDNVLARMQRQKAHLDSLAMQQSPYVISNLQSNSPLADFGAVFYGNQVVFSSGRDTIGTGGRIYKRNNQPYLKLYVADRHEADGSLFGSREFLPEAQTGYHNATACFSADGKTIYFSTNTVKKSDRLVNGGEGTNNLRLMRGTIDNGKISDVSELPFSSKEYSVSHPALSPDGQWLYFVSDMPGGYGGTDIYKAAVKADGTFGQPENLGSNINTIGNEMFPFVQQNKLYFASDGHYGLGGLDVFESRIKGSRFLEPQNLGSPVNSNRDDFAYITDSTGTSGYFSSNRDGGRGDDDIYAFRRQEPPCSRLLAGTVADPAGKPVAGATVTIYDAADAVVATILSGADGSYSVEVPCNGTIRAETSKAGYTSAKIPIELELSGAPVKLSVVDIAALVINDNGVEKIKIDPIFFEFDKSNISSQAAAELDKVVYVLKNFPSVIIKIESHTDSRGKDDYNLRLSQARADATYDYILAQGIAPGRIQNVAGYGETRLINGCGNGADCTEEEHLRNRRSEFIIVKR